jgi:hypothetical protein
MTSEQDRIRQLHGELIRVTNMLNTAVPHGPADPDDPCPNDCKRCALEKQFPRSEADSTEKPAEQPLKCDRCDQAKPDVCERPNGYLQDVGNEPDAKWVACDECDHENNMDI